MTAPVSNEDLMRYLDDELPPGERVRVERALEASTELRRNMAVYRAMQRELAALPGLPRRGASIWSAVNRRLTRPLGWILLTAGFVLWSAYGAWVFYTSPVNPVEKLAVGAMAVGFLILLAATIFERMREWRDDPYRDVDR